MKNSIKITVLLLLTLSSISLVYSSSFTNHDFGNFTMDIPEDTSLKEDSSFMLMSGFTDYMSGDQNSVNDSFNDSKI